MPHIKPVFVSRVKSDRAKIEIDIIQQQIKDHYVKLCTQKYTTKEQENAGKNWHTRI